MKIDTSSYYPKSPLDDEEESIVGTSSLFGEEKTETQEIPTTPVNESPARDEAEMVPKEESEPDLPPTETERAIDGIATILSWVLVPLLMPVYGILLAFGLSILTYTPFPTKVIFTATIFGINVFVPALLVMLLKKAGVVQDLGLNGQKERLIPYIITILCMAGTGIFLWMKLAPSWLVMFYLGGAAAGLINMVVNFRWKISAHSAAIAGIVALLVRIMHNGVPMDGVLTWLMISIGAGGLLGSARVWLGRHTVMQVLSGFAVGFCCVFFLTMIKL